MVPGVPLNQNTSQIQHVKKFTPHFIYDCLFPGRDAHVARGYPIGLVSANWGATNIETWSSPSGLRKCAVNDSPPKTPPLPARPGCKHLGEPCTSPDGYHSDECCGGRCFYYAKPPLWPGGGYCDEASPTNQDSVLWNNIITPLLKMRIFGVVWYQGESDARGHAAKNYACTFPTMVDDWRAAWHHASGTDPIFPFGFVMLSATGAGTSGAVAPDTELGWAILRASQTTNHFTVPNPRQPRTFMSVAIDLAAYEGGCCSGKPDQAACNTYPSLCIHPWWKQEVGRRLWLGANAIAYGDGNATVCFQGPTARSATAGSRGGVTVQFHVAEGCGNGIELRRGADFDLGTNGSWVLARAVLGPAPDTVTVTPVDPNTGGSAGVGFDQVRYLWSQSPCAHAKDDSAIGNCSVYNTDEAAGEGLPAPPFILNVTSTDVST